MFNHVKTIMLLGLLTTLLVAIGGFVSPSLLPLFIVLALAMNVGAYFWSDKLVLRMHGARELGPEEAPDLHRMVETLAQRAAIPRPKLYLIEDAQPNAFATGRNPEHGVVAVTTGLLSILDRREVNGVLAHEIGHIQNRDILIQSVAAVIGSAISGVANALQFGALFGGSSSDEEEGSGAGGLALAFIAPIAAMLVQFGISRSREYLADEAAARLTGDPEAMASALLRLESVASQVPAATPAPATASLFIVNPLAGIERMSRWFSTHPPIAERVERLRAMDAEMRRLASA